MGSIFLIKLVADSETELYRYQLGNFKRIQYNVNTPVTPMPIPEEDAKDNVLIKIEGNSSDITLNWVIKDNNGVDLETVSNTPTSTIKEQIDFFRGLFKPQKIEDDYKLILRLDDNDVTQDIEYKGTFTQFTFIMADPELLVFKAQAKFLEGTIALGFEVDSASEPLNLVVTSPSTGTINANWDIPSEAGSSSITDYRVHYRQFGTGGQWNYTDVGSSTTLLNDISGSTVLPQEVFEVAVMAKTSVGFGRPSKTKLVTVL